MIHIEDDEPVVSKRSAFFDHELDEEADEETGMDSALTRGEVIDDLMERLIMEGEMELLTGDAASQGGRGGSGERKVGRQRGVRGGVRGDVREGIWGDIRGGIQGSGLG